MFVLIYLLLFIYLYLFDKKKQEVDTDPVFPGKKHLHGGGHANGDQGQAGQPQRSPHPGGSPAFHLSRWGHRLLDGFPLAHSQARERG